MFVQLLEQHGESEMAQQFLMERPAHERCREAGRLFFFDPLEPDLPPDPRWLESFLGVVAGSVVLSHPLGKLDHKVTNESGFWEVRVFLPADQPWAIDVMELQRCFAQIDSLGWYGAPPDAGDTPYLWAEGEYLQQKFFLRISGIS
jgi:hypothetical protein